MSQYLLFNAEVTEKVEVWIHLYLPIRLKERQLQYRKHANYTVPREARIT